MAFLALNLKKYSLLLSSPFLFSFFTIQSVILWYLFWYIV